MTKALFGLSVVSLILLAGASAARAQSSIGFGDGGSDSTGLVTFISNGDGSTASLDLGTCDVSNICVLSGFNGQSFSHTGTYSLTTTETGLPNDDIQVGPFIGGGGDHSVTMNGATTVFTWHDNGGFDLMGNVVWNDAITNGAARIAGILTVVTSNLTDGLAMGSTVQIDFTTNHYNVPTLASIFGSTVPGTQGSATVSVGEAFAPVPEPASMLLLGSGLLACGAFIRRRGATSVASA